MHEIRDILTHEKIEASAPCRIDMGGTLDLSTFYLPMRHLEPCTFNIALDLRTHVRLKPWQKGRLKVTSRGFEGVDVELSRAPFAHPLGLMMAVATYFQADGVHIDIHSASPPRSALGGSSVAAVALIWALSKACAKTGRPMPRRSTVALTAHAIEQSIAGVPCGMQDQLAAVYGGINGWYWQVDPEHLPFRRVELVSPSNASDWNSSFMVAYCGAPHVSKDVNATWVRQFVAGENRDVWRQIVTCSRQFIEALEDGALEKALEMMNRETMLRCGLTPHVLDKTGSALVKAAQEHQCAARFTGAGGGGCVWALGQAEHLVQLKPAWEQILSRQASAQLLKTTVDTNGLL